MPEYTFKHPKNKKTVSIIQKMSEPHVYVDGDGVQWERVFEVPNAQIDATIDPFSKKDFIEKTSKKKMTMGNMWDLSAELSAKRKKVVGKDFVKEKAAQTYRDKTGKPHPHE